MYTNLKSFFILLRVFMEDQMPVMPASGYFNILSQTYTEEQAEPIAAHITGFFPDKDVPNDALYGLIKNVGNHSALWSVFTATIESEKYHYPTLDPKEKQECWHMLMILSRPLVKVRSYVEKPQISPGDTDQMRRILNCVRDVVAKKKQAESSV